MLAVKGMVNRRLWILVVVVLVACSGVTAAAQERAANADVQDRPIITLRDLNQAFVDLASRVKPAVVTVSTERIFNIQRNPYRSPFTGDPFMQFFFGPRRGQQQPEERQYRQEGLGSGVIVDPNGTILTNNHVVAEADSIFVTTIDGKRYSADVLGTDPQTDIAVLKVDAAGLTSVKIGNSDNLEVGEMVLAIGSPMSANLAHTVTQGIVSAKGRSNVGLAEYEDFIQTDAAINPGNSGGPLVNLNGELVGINTAIVSRSGGFQGIGFAVPSSMALRVMNSLIADGKVVRGWLGVSIQDVNETIAGAMGLSEVAGALVGDVAENSPAEAAGLEVGDLILAVDDYDISSSVHLRNRIASTQPGTRVMLYVLRGDQKLQLPVTLGELPADGAVMAGEQPADQLLGFTAADISNVLAREYNLSHRTGGVVVTSVAPESEAYRSGLREGDVIRSVNRRRINNLEEFYDRVEPLGSGDALLLGVYRQGRGFFIAFKLHE